MATNDGSTLERFRRVAANHRLPAASSDGSSPCEEIETLRARLNGRVYSRAERWMLPHWVLQTIGPRQGSPSDDRPLVNNHHRNWTIVGGVGGLACATSDPSGLLTANADCGSIEFWPQGPDGILHPALVTDTGPRLVLLSTEDQIYEWKTQLGPVGFSRLVYHVKQDRSEAVYNEIQIRNLSLVGVTFTFYCVLRPMSVRGVEPIEAIEYDSPRRAVYANGMLAILLDHDPYSILMTTADNPNLVKTMNEPSKRFDREFSTARGLATSVLRFDVRLKPAGTDTFFFVSPLGRIAKTGQSPRFHMGTHARDTAVESWFEFAGTTLSVRFPERDWDPALAQSKAILAMKARAVLQVEGDDCTALSWAERARVLCALSRYGSLDLVKEASSDLAEQVVQGHTAEVSDVAAVAWSLLQASRYSRDGAFLAKIRPMIDKVVLDTMKSADKYLQPNPVEVKSEAVQATEQGTEATETQTASQSSLLNTDAVVGDAARVESPALGVLRPRSPPPRLTSFSDFAGAAWALAFLQSASAAYHSLGEDSRVQTLTEIARRYAAFIKDCSKEQLAEFDARAKEAPTEQGILDAVSLLGTVALLQTSEIDPSYLDRVASTFVSRYLTKGVLRLPGRPEEVSSHLALRAAHYQVMRRNRAAAETAIHAAQKLLSEYHGLPDWADLKTGQGTRGSGLSVVAASDMLLLLRDMIVIEDGEDLIVVPAIPDNWYTSGNELTLANAPVGGGRVRVELGTSTNQHQIEVWTEALPRELEVYLPTTRALSMVKVYGGSIVNRFGSAEQPHLRIVPLWESVVITFHR